MQSLHHYEAHFSTGKFTFFLVCCLNELFKLLEDRAMDEEVQEMLLVFTSFTKTLD